MLKYNLGQKVMYKGIETKIIGVDKSDMALRRYAIGYVDPSPLATSHNLNIRVFGNRLRDFEYLEGEPNGHTWVTAGEIKEIAKPKAVKVNLDNLMEVGKWLTKITPETTKIYSFADLHGKKSACGNFFIEATPTLVKVFTKTATRDSVGVFQVGRTSKLNTLADLTNFGFELYELVEFELSDVTRKKFAGFGNKKVCKLASIGDVWFVRVYHDGKDGQYDTISLTKEDKINKAEFLVEEVK